jgi:hypothetical protein
MLKKLFIWLVSAAAAIYSVFMLARTAPRILDAFRLTDPTGMFGLYSTLGGFLANLCVVFLFLVLVRRGIKSKIWFDKIPVPFVFAFVLKLIEAVALLPCLAGEPGALCGVLSVGASFVSAPLIIVITGRVITGTRDASVRLAGLLLLAALALFGAAAWWRITPKNPVECGYIPEISARGNCLNAFAMRNLDMGICRQIDFRSTRYDCMRKIAQETRRPELCEEIQTPPDVKISNFEAPASETRDLCYYVLAFDLGRHDLCLKISGGEKRKTCLEKVAPQAGQ